MRFGLFVPQGWRLDLAGIDAEGSLGDHARRRPGGRRTGPFESIWVFDHFHTVPVPTQEATHEAWTLMAALRRRHQPGPARPDVHLHGLPQPRLPGQGRGDGGRDLRRPGRDGHRGGLVRARVARLRLRLPQGGRPHRHARRGRPDHAPALDGGTATLDGKHYQVDGAICRPLPLQDGGVPLWIAGGGEKQTLRIAARYAQLHQLRRHTGRVPAQVGDPRAALRARSAPTSTRSPGPRTTTWSSAKPRRTCRTGSPG